MNRPDGPAVAILIPMLGRAHHVEGVIESLELNTPRGTWRALFICSTDDPTTSAHCRYHADNRSEYVDVITVPWPGGSVGDYARKINAGVTRTNTAFVFQGACDIRFHPDWWQATSRLMSNRVGVVGTNDLCNPRTRRGRRPHSTHSLVARRYIDRHGTIDEPGKLLHESYWHEFTDDEMVRTAQHRHAYAHAVDAIVEHLHPDCGGAPSDALYAAQPARMTAGREIFRERQHLWGGTVRV